MIARVDFHVVKQGMVEGAKKQVVDNTKVAKATGQVAGRYMLLSQKDSHKLVTVTLWNKKEAIAEYIKNVVADIKKRGEPDPWGTIEGDEYEVTQLVKDGAKGSAKLAKVDSHVVKQGKEELSRAKIVINTEIARSTGAVVDRYLLTSLKSPLKVVTLTFWTDKKAIEQFVEKAVAVSKLIPGESPWSSIVGDEYDVTKLV